MLTNFQKFSTMFKKICCLNLKFYETITAKIDVPKFKTSVNYSKLVNIGFNFQHECENFN